MVAGYPPATNFMIAFDTNVLVYYCDRRDQGRQRIAIDLVDDASDGILLWQVACEFIAASRKLAQFGLTSELSWAHLADFIQALPLVLPSFRVLDAARSLHLEHQWSFWDAMLIGACLEAGIERLYSEDLPGRKPPGNLEIVNPFA